MVETFLPAGETIGFDREALALHLARHGLAFDPRAPVRQFAGGLANRNYLVEIAGELAVLRRPPAGELPRGAHDMAREHRVMSALAPVLAFVPAALHFTADPSVLGAPFQLIEYRAGVVARGTQPPDWLSPDAGEALADVLIDTLAQLHEVDASSCGLGDLGRPDGFVPRAVEGWTRRGLEVAAGGPSRLVADLSVWLRAQRVADRAPCVLHLDFKLDNMILEPATRRPLAVVDWDMGTRGDPLFDLATLLSYWVEPGDPEPVRRSAMMPTTCGILGSRRRAAEAYGRRMGLALDDLPALYVLALLKLGVVFLQLHRQWMQGAVRSDRYAAFDQHGVAVLAFAWDVASGRQEGL